MTSEQNQQTKRALDACIAIKENITALAKDMEGITVASNDGQSIKHQLEDIQERVAAILEAME